MLLVCMFTCVLFRPGIENRVKTEDYMSSYLVAKWYLELDMAFCARNRNTARPVSLQLGCLRSPNPQELIATEDNYILLGNVTWK